MKVRRKSPVLIAEIGCNHKGSMKIAKEMIRVAANCGANYVKFQKGTINTFLVISMINHIQSQKTHMGNLMACIENF